MLNGMEYVLPTCTMNLWQMYRLYRVNIFIFHTLSINMGYIFQYVLSFLWFRLLGCLDGSRLVNVGGRVGSSAAATVREGMGA